MRGKEEINEYERSKTIQKILGGDYIYSTINNALYYVEIRKHLRNSMTTTT